MAEFKIKYQIRQPTSFNQRTGGFRYQSSGYMSNPITVTANDELEARKKAAKHPTLLEKKDYVNKRIDSSVQDRGGKARHKITSVTKVSGGGRGGGGTLKMPQEYSKTALSKKTLMNKGGVVKAMKNGGAVMNGRGPKFKGQS
jgi:hypothetical protein